MEVRTIIISVAVAIAIVVIGVLGYVFKDNLFTTASMGNVVSETSPSLAGNVVDNTVKVQPTIDLGLDKNRLPVIESDVLKKPEETATAKKDEGMVMINPGGTATATNTDTLADALPSVNGVTKNPVMINPSTGTENTLADAFKPAPVTPTELICTYGTYSKLNEAEKKHECVAYCKSTEEFKGLDETTKKPTCVAKDGGGGVRPDGPYPDDCKADQYVKYNEQTVKYECANYCSTDQVFKGLDATTKKATCVAKTAIDDTKGRTVITCNTGSYAKLNDTTKKYECTAYCATGQEFKGLDATTKKATCVATAPATASGSATASPAKAAAASATASKAATTKTVAKTGASLPLVTLVSLIIALSFGLVLRLRKA